MDAAHALAELTQVSTQIEGAVLAESGGRVLASTYEDARGGRVAKAALELLEAADRTRDGAELTQVLAETGTGAVFVVRSGPHVAAAVTKPDPISGLIFYDLKTCLRMLEEKPAKAASGRSARRATPTKKTAAKRDDA
jgi:predicted regulator of Ras-like GTPase activity (Roadblock/LC7/MglB family)